MNAFKKILCIALVVGLTSCITTSKGVEIKPYVYPTLNKTHLTNVFKNNIIAYNYYDDHKFLRAFFFKAKADDDLEKLKNSIGFKVGVRIRW